MVSFNVSINMDSSPLFFGKRARERHAFIYVSHVAFVKTVIEIVLKT